ncbi:MAG: FAD-dependent oxidoreductase [Kaiparowitsia implicata GSE-PSE-MK54-09C]|jgi:glycine/D-amino acid oxidase-like deaminating enzyme/nitrite reductase/ring-hydroxylating ferredoxin subunit|nr:FAD-dependent oxidoreductase [Kaiparowitsia implicata GSE-PSE-MK54-09C]
MVYTDKPSSFWIESTPKGQFPPFLPESLPDLRVDVAIVGGGIAGITAAMRLKQAGKTVAVVEADQIGTGVTGHTTAKVTSQHHLIYASLVKDLGEEKAKLYAESNQAAIAQVFQWVQTQNIDCDFSRRTAYVFAEQPEQLTKVKDEVEAAQTVGLPASFTTDLSLPFPVLGAVAFEGQAQFHPRKYLLHLAKMIADEGSYVFEQTRVTSVDEGTPCKIVTERGNLYAQDVLITTNLPILDQGLYFAKAYPRRSYIVAAEISPEQAPDGMYIGTGDSYRSLRTTPEGDRLLLLIGGEGHKVGAVTNTAERFANLEAYGRERFGITDYAYRWSSQDVKSFDNVPYIGKLTPANTHIFVATGFGLWGMSNGTLAGMLLSDLVQGKDNPWADLYDSLRATPFLTSTSLQENLDVGKRWVGDRLKGLTDNSINDVVTGEGKLLTIEGKKVAAYRDDEGQVHAVSATCTHLGCIVNWNNAEKSWDCPCHGARFDCQGKILHGPAVTPLEQIKTS